MDPINDIQKLDAALNRCEFQHLTYSLVKLDEQAYFVRFEYKYVYYTLKLLEECQTFLKLLRRWNGPQVIYCIIGTNSFGGDLSYFLQQRQRGEEGKQKLVEYARLCVECVYMTATMSQLANVIMIGFVDKFAVGGGFETIIACAICFAREEAQFGLLEGNSGIIAGMGAEDLGTLRSASPEFIFTMMKSCRLYTTEDMQRQNFVDFVITEGATVLEALQMWLDPNIGNEHKIRLSLARRNLLLQPVDYERLTKTASGSWVDAVMGINSDTEKAMRVRARDQRMKQLRLVGKVD